MKARRQLCAMVAGFLLASHTAANSAPPDWELARLGLTPLPKKVVLGGWVTLSAPVRVIGEQAFPASGAWLRQILRQHIGPVAETEQEPAVCKVILRKLRLPQGDEAFRMEIHEQKITLSAGGEAGMFRAVGRLARILESRETEHGVGNVRCRALRLEDWPDMRLRGMHLQMAWNPNEALIRDTVEVMARLGFNMVGYELGSRYDYKSHPECCHPGDRWTFEQVRRLVVLAKSRGITPIPCLNAIGHVERAPLVCILPDPDWQKCVMDLTDPNFYPIFFDLLDELISAFDNPPCIHIGTDECTEALARLAKLRGRSAESLYSEFVNRVTAYLRERQVRPVIWSDMLLARKAFPDEPANATDECPTDRALEQLDRGVIINYWNYNPSSYRGLELFRRKGFSVWASPWYEPKGVAQLCWKAHKVGADAVLGTTWSEANQVADGIVLTAEYSWNAARSAGRYVQYEPYAVANDLYCSRGRWERVSASPVTVQGGSALPEVFKRHLIEVGLPVERNLHVWGITFALNQPRFLGAGVPRELKEPGEILEAARKGHRLMLFLSNGYAWPVDGVNTPRGEGQTIIYVATPQFSSTGTNRWGCEWVVRKGRVVKIYPPAEDSGNAPLPTDGFVISAHGFPRPSGYAFLRERLHVGDQVKVLALPIVRESTVAEGSLNGEFSGLALLLTAFYPVPEKANLGEIIVETDIGHEYAMQLSGSVSLPGLHQLRWHYPPTRGNGWRIWPAWVNYEKDRAAIVLAYEWQPPQPSERPRKLRLHIAPEGRMLGVTLLGVSAW